MGSREGQDRAAGTYAEFAGEGLLREVRVCADVNGGRIQRGGEGSTVLQEARGGSFFEPRPEFQMMQVEAKELEAELAHRAEQRVPAAGIEYICVRFTGVEGLRDAGVLKVE